MLPAIKALLDDKRFSQVSPETKTDIIHTIGLAVDDAEEEVAESKFSRKTLKEALHYLLATEAKDHPQVKNLLLMQANDSQAIGKHQSSPYSAGNPFYFGQSDPLFLYCWGFNSGQSTALPGGGGDCSGEAVVLICAGVCVCASGACCAYCMKQTIEGPESNAVKTAKVTAASASGVGVFVGLLCYLILNDIWRNTLVNNEGWDVKGYYTLLAFVAASAGLLTSGAVSTVNNIAQCVPEEQKTQESKESSAKPEPSPEIKAALKELDPIKKLLVKGWHREGDGVKQCQAFTREIILAYINAVAAPEARKEITVSIALSPHAKFNSARPQQPPSPSDAYLLLRSEEHEDAAASPRVRL